MNQIQCMPKSDFENFDDSENCEDSENFIDSEKVRFATFISNEKYVTRYKGEYEPIINGTF